MIQQDSIQQTYQTVGGDTAVAVHRPLTPAQVLSWLPRSATPAQQDSAIQAHFKPSEIRWSNRPDTLHLPGHDRGHNMLDVNIPQYYREGFFSKDTLFHPELPGGRYGVAGDPRPYTVHTDNVLTGMLLSSFLLAVVAFVFVKHFMLRHLKSLVYGNRAVNEQKDTGLELQFEIFLNLLAALLLSLLYYFYTLHYIGETFILSSQYYLIGINFLIFVAYYLLRMLLYTMVNNVFFDGKKNGQWIHVLLFIACVECVLFFPIAMMVSYSNISVENIEFYFVLALGFVKLLTIYQCYNIFFRTNVVKLQIILYFCALEIVPLLILWGVLDLTANSLKINF